jgi:hypothetical protein
MFPKTWLACIALIAAWATPIQAHDIYTHLMNKRGASCCDGSECRPALYRIRPWGVQMQVDDGWFDISEDLIDYRMLENDTGETNGGHWCGRHETAPYSTWMYFKTYCAFLPPKLTVR